MTGFSRMVAEIAGNVAKAFKYRAQMSALEWSQSVRRMADGTHFRPWPYQVEMIETPYREDIQRTVYQMASRTGKTEVVMNLIGHSIDEDPRSILVLYPTISQATKWSKETLTRELLEPTPSLSYLSAGGRRLSSNTILHKIFPGGILNAFGGNSPGEMRRAKGNFLFADEIDALESSESDEGDQLGIFLVRGSEFANTIAILASYPGLKGDSRIEDAMAQSDYRRWVTPCAHCGEGVILTRDDLRYDASALEAAYFEAPCCKAPISDFDRRAMIHAGEWQASKPFTGIAGFWGNGCMSLHPPEKGFTGLAHSIALREVEAERAENPEKARRVIVNTFDSHAFQPEVVSAPDRHRLMAGRESWDGTPDGVLFVTAGVDIQLTWKEVSVWGWGENGQKWLLDHEKLDGGPDDPRTFDRLLSWFSSRKYEHANGYQLSVFGKPSKPTIFVDSSWSGDKVMRWTSSLAHLGIYACQGQATINAPIVGEKRRNPNPRTWYYPVGVNQAKETIYGWLTLPQPGKDAEPPINYAHFPHWAYEEYFRALTAEEGKEEKFRGEIFIRYECPKGRRNEALDCFVYAYAAQAASKPNYPALAKRAAAGKPKVAKKKRRRLNWKL